MRVLIASVAKQTDDVFLPHRETLRWQKSDAEVSHLVVDDGLSAGAVRALGDAGVEVWAAGPKPADAQYAVTETTHQWTIGCFHWLAREKQRILDHGQRYDAVLLVDSDLFLAPGTLTSLISAEKPVVSAVFWTSWHPETAPQPNVWLSHPYDAPSAHPDFTTPLLEVRGLGACTLIRRDALQEGAAYWPLVDGLPAWGMWQGEDRHFSVRCNRLGIQLWADARPRVWHCYRPSDVQKIPDVMASLQNAN